ncbi:hypothetical protein PVAP13_4NG343601 [Panicum virgatum]|uniref:Uncharacterized protein n=1 Tax=Panicum virgatum TaxID=38727 RepID=A0A8T0TL80_PANVG|nr:hypothetical protein PVAP13_4NG343601 [Panicum virgatum]
MPLLPLHPPLTYLWAPHVSFFFFPFFPSRCRRPPPPALCARPGHVVGGGEDGGRWSRRRASLHQHRRAPGRPGGAAPSPAPRAPAPRSRIAQRQAAQPYHRGTGAVELHIWHAAFAATNSPASKSLSSQTSQHVGARWSSIRGSRSSARRPHVPTCSLSCRPPARRADPPEPAGHTPPPFACPPAVRPRLPARPPVGCATPSTRSPARARPEVNLR